MGSPVRFDAASERSSAATAASLSAAGRSSGSVVRMLAGTAASISASIDG